MGHYLYKDNLWTQQIEAKQRNEASFGLGGDLSHFLDDCQVAVGAIFGRNCTAGDIYVFRKGLRRWRWSEISSACSVQRFRFMELVVSQ